MTVPIEPPAAGSRPERATPASAPVGPARTISGPARTISGPARTISGPALVDLLGSWSARSGPLYRLLADRIARLADTGELPPGVRLPPERELAAAASVSRNTATAAYQHLRDEGLAETRQGSGTRITPHRTTPAAVHRANAFFARLLAAATIDVDLTLAAPDCAPLVRAALDDPRSVLDRAARRAVTEGSGYHLLGLPAMRAAVAGHCTGVSGVPTTVDRVLVTTGAQQAIDLLMRCYVLPGHPVLVQDPTFPGVIDAMYRAGARPIGLPADDGVDPDQLAHAVATHRPAVVYLVATHHNPTGQVLGDRCRQRVVALAAEYPDTLFVDDVALAELDLDAESPGRPDGPGRPVRPGRSDRVGPLAALEPRLPNLVTVGSLSKVYWGGLRLGWVRADPGVIGRLAATKAAADLGAPTLPQAIGAALLADSHAEILRWRVEQLRLRRAALEDALREYLPNWAWRTPPGGLSLWVDLGTADGGAADSGTYAQLALRRGIAVVPGRLFSVTDRHDDRIRIAYADPPERLRRGVLGLAAACRDRAAGP